MHACRHVYRRICISCLEELWQDGVVVADDIWLQILGEVPKCNARILAYLRLKTLPQKTPTVPSAIADGHRRRHDRTASVVEMGIY